MKPEKFWAIHHKHIGFYCGTFLTRKDAIKEHTQALGYTWQECRKRGDRAVRVEVRPC